MSAPIGRSVSGPFVGRSEGLRLQRCLSDARVLEAGNDRRALKPSPALRGLGLPTLNTVSVPPADLQGTQLDL